MLYLPIYAILLAKSHLNAWRGQASIEKEEVEKGEREDDGASIIQKLKETFFSGIKIIQ